MISIVKKRSSGSYVRIKMSDVQRGTIGYVGIKSGGGKKLRNKVRQLYEVQGVDMV